MSRSRPGRSNSVVRKVINGTHVFKRTSNKNKLAILFAGRKHRPCVYCGKALTLQSASFDHVKPLSAGGYDRAKNGEVTCKQCNNAKGSMSKGEYMAKVKGLQK